MRIWSLHPKYLDTKGLVALWRETLLAQKVLKGGTKGYKNHPQLVRFRETKDPVAAVAAYLSGVADEADKRGYNFNRDKIEEGKFEEKILVTKGQMDYELKHLSAKLEKRDPERLASLNRIKKIIPHPSFRIIEGGIEPWEIV